MDEGLKRKIKNDFEELKGYLEEIVAKKSFLEENLSEEELKNHLAIYTIIEDAAITNAYRKYFELSVEEMKAYHS
jgi:helix-turn-helix protein